MSTFAEIANEARVIAPSQSLGSIDYCRMIARLAEALERFEYNVARGLSRSGPGEYLSIEAVLENLRRPLPTPEAS